MGRVQDEMDKRAKNKGSIHATFNDEDEGVWIEVEMVGMDQKRIDMFLHEFVLQAAAKMEVHPTEISNALSINLIRFGFKSKGEQ